LVEPKDHFAAIYEVFVLLVSEGEARRRELFRKLGSLGTGSFNETANIRTTRLCRAVANLKKVFLESKTRYFGLG
jgi:hypothetical protein